MNVCETCGRAHHTEKSGPHPTLPGGTVYRLLNGHSWAAMRAFAKVWGGVPEIMDESRRTFRLFNSIYRVVECEGGWDVVELARPAWTKRGEE